MAIKTYLISCLILANCNVQATKLAHCCEESDVANGGYFASGSAHSSQYLLPNGEVVTHSKGNSFSNGGIRETFEQLKHEANQFVNKQKDTINIPNPLPPLHTGLDEDLQKIVGNVQYPFSNIFNKLESSSQQNKDIYAGVGQTGTIYYPAPVLPQTKVVSTKKDQFHTKKIVTQGGSGSPLHQNGNEEIEVGQNTLDSTYLGNTNFQTQPVTSFQNVYKSGSSQKEIETLDSLKQPIVPAQKTQKIQALPLSAQTSYKYENIVKQNSTNQVQSGFPTYIPNGKLTTGLIELTSNDGQNVQLSNLNPFLSTKVPSKLMLGKEKLYNKEEETVNYNENVENVVVNSETNSQQKEHKYSATPVNKGAEPPLKIKYTYDGKTLKKYEVYASGAQKLVPISVEETESTLKEIQSQDFTQTSQSFGVQPSSHVKEEGYYYPAKSQSLFPASNVQTFKKEESQSHSHQTITSGDSSASNVEQFAHLPLNVDSQKQYSQSGYAGVLAPISASQVSEEKNSQASQVFSGANPAILVRGVPQFVPFPSQQSGSIGSTFQSNAFSGSNADFAFPSEFFSNGAYDSQLASSFHQLSGLNQNSGSVLPCDDCLTGLSASKLPVKSSYGISSSFSSSSSNINGNKSENRQASVTVNDNGKVDTYNVKS